MNQTVLTTQIARFKTLLEAMVPYDRGLGAAWPKKLQYIPFTNIDEKARGHVLFRKFTYLVNESRDGYFVEQGGSNNRNQNADVTFWFLYPLAQDAEALERVTSADRAQIEKLFTDYDNRVNNCHAVQLRGSTLAPLAGANQDQMVITISLNIDTRETIT